METIIPADQLLQKIQQLLDDNPSSLLNFTAEKETAKKLVDGQHEKIAHLQFLHQEMLELQDDSEVSINEIRRMKATFDQAYQAYKKEYSSLKELYLTLAVSFVTEKYVLKQCFFGESDQMLSKIIEKTADQDLEIAQLKEFVSSFDED